MKKYLLFVFITLFTANIFAGLVYIKTFLPSENFLIEFDGDSIKISDLKILIEDKKGYSHHMQRLFRNDGEKLLGDDEEIMYGDIKHGHPLTLFYK